MLHVLTWIAQIDISAAVVCPVACVDVAIFDELKYQSSTLEKGDLSVNVPLFALRVLVVEHCEHTNSRMLIILTIDTTHIMICPDKNAAANG